MTPEGFNVFSAVNDSIFCVYEAEYDSITVLHGVEQLFSIERASAKGAPTYDPWVIQCWVWDNYLDFICDCLILKGAV